MNDIYPEELGNIFASIKERRYDYYLIQLAIATNPHLKQEHQKALWESFQPPKTKEIEQIDLTSGFDRLKDAMSNSKRIIVKS